MSETGAPPLSPTRRRERAAGALLIAALGVVAALVPALHPLPFDLCLWRRLTGFPCPGCGLTRSICLLVQGHWTASLEMHPAGVLFLALLVLSATSMGIEAALGRPTGGRVLRRLASGLIVAGAAVSLLRWVGRVLPI